MTGAPASSLAISGTGAATGDGRAPVDLVAIASGTYTMGLTRNSGHVMTKTAVEKNRSMAFIPASP